MKNFQVIDKDTNKTYWISRSVAVCAIVMVLDKDNNPYILINKRGDGTPDFQHHWNIPCGYLDWDETTSEACSREILEECKIYIDPKKWTMFGDIDDSIMSNNQNVTVRKKVLISYDQYKIYKEIGINMIESNGGEINEVEDIELMALTKENINNHNWAFNHKQLVSQLLDIFCKTFK